MSAVREITFGKIIAAVFIVALMYADFFALYDLLHSSGSNKEVAIALSFTIAVCLEGLPVVIGQTLSALKSKPLYREDEQKAARITMWIALVAMFLVFALVISMRAAQIQSNGGYEHFKSTDHFYGGNASAEEEFYLHVLMQWSPIITSVTAFAVSRIAFPSRPEAKLKKEVKRLQNEYLKKEASFRKTMDQLDGTRIQLWSKLSEGAPMPDSLLDFRREAFKRIREKLTGNCVLYFPGQRNFYQTAVEGFLDEYIKRMNRMCGITLEITAADVLKEFDETADSIDAWDQEYTDSALIAELLLVMNNAIEVAQYKTSRSRR